MGDFESMRDLIKTRSSAELIDKSEAKLIEKGLIKTKVFGWLSEEEYNFAGNALKQAGFNKLPDELDGIPTVEETVSESRGTGGNLDIYRRTVVKVLPFVFRLQELIKMRHDGDLRREAQERANMRGIMATEPEAAKEETIKPCPICGSDKFTESADYKTVKWADCKNCGTRYEQLSGKTYKEWNDENKA